MLLDTLNINMRHALQSCPLDYSGQVQVSVDITFSSTITQELSIKHGNLFSYLPIDWNTFCDFLRDIQWNDIFNR